MSSASNYNQQAQLALEEADSQKAEALFLELVVSLEDAFNKNQKDVAAELQRIAKQIETSGKIDDSLRFKQRTCEIMLRRSMAERRRNQAPPNKEPEKDGKLLRQLVFVCFTADPGSYSAFLTRTELVSELRLLPDGSRLMRSKSDSQLLLLCRQGRLSGYFPLFIASSRDEAARQLQGSGHFIDGDEIDLCGSKLLVIRDRAGQKFLLASADFLQEISK